MNTTTPLLTIVIPAYNVEKTLERAILSIVNRKDKNLVEILIIDDGSTDGTYTLGKELSRTYSNKANNIRIVRKNNGGHGSVINAGIKLAKGRYFKILDGDDELYGKNLDILLKTISSSKSDLVASDYFEKYPDKKITVRWGQFRPFKDIKYDSIISASSNALLPVSTVKTSILKNSEFLIDEKCFYDDQEYDFLLINEVRTVSYINKPVYIYHLGNPTQSVAIEGFKKNIKSHEKVCLRLLDEYYKVVDELPNNKRNFIHDELLIKLSHQQYRIAIYMKKSRKDFLDFDKELKKYPDIYNDYRVAGRKIRLHRLTRGVLI